MVAVEVGDLAEVVGVDFGPALIDEFLHGGGHFPIVDADASGFVGLGIAVVEAVAEEAVHLLDAIFVGAFGLHDLVEQRDVKWHDRDCRTCLGDECLVHRDPCLAVEWFEFGVEFALHAFEVFLGAADGAVLVNRPSDFGSDVRISNRLHALGEKAFGEQRVYPHLPIFATHHGYGLCDIIALGGLDGDFIHNAGAGVEVTVGIALADRLEHGFVDFAGFGIGAAWRGEAVNHAVDLAEVAFDRGDHLGLHRVGEGIAIERASVESGSAGFIFECGRVVPSGGAALVGFGGFFEKDTDRRSARAKGGGDARGEAVAGGGADHEDLLRSVGDGAAIFHDGDLLGNMLGAADRMSGGADESTDFGCDDHMDAKLSVSRLMAIMIWWRSS